MTSKKSLLWFAYGQLSAVLAITLGEGIQHLHAGILLVAIPMFIYAIFKKEEE